MKIRVPDETLHDDLFSRKLPIAHGQNLIPIGV
jgi:hypothetical protein